MGRCFLVACISMRQQISSSESHHSITCAPSHLHRSCPGGTRVFHSTQSSPSQPHLWLYHFLRQISSSSLPTPELSAWMARALSLSRSRSLSASRSRSRCCVLRGCSACSVGVDLPLSHGPVQSTRRDERSLSIGWDPPKRSKNVPFYRLPGTLRLPICLVLILPPALLLPLPPQQLPFLLLCRLRSSTGPACMDWYTQWNPEVRGWEGGMPQASRGIPSLGTERCQTRPSPSRPDTLGATGGCSPAANHAPWGLLLSCRRAGRLQAGEEV